MRKNLQKIRKTLVSVREAAEILQITPTRVRQLIAASLLPAMTFDVERVLLREDVENFTLPAKGRPKKN